ncbi:MAG TPA: glycoside hydrolase family 2 TIM barrel-domain containing protein [Candidatus Dormibacteraeota bacterium]|nr:glycoside hydrolase family 2 TIM barrel-domain containing protein [Candidatus Dormibacteraeota bacterium]
MFDRRIVVPFAPQSQLSGLGVWEEADDVWYRKRFDAPTADRLLMRFGAVDYRATVWVNGEEVARHEGGHTPFFADITKAVREHDNEVIVHAEDAVGDTSIPRGKQRTAGFGAPWFYTPTTGIWQTVWLEPLPDRAIRGLQLEPDFDACALAFEVDGDGAKEVVASFDGKPVGRWAGDGVAGRIALEELHPWSPESPNLYGLDVRCGSDHVVSYFGLRKVEARDGRFLLNGEPYIQRLILDQGYFPGGLLTAATDSDLRRDIELAKAMGFNGARKHQKVEDPRWLYWADMLGFLVWGEMPDLHEASAPATARFEEEWRDRVARDRNHPSVVAWVPVNETMGLKKMDPADLAEHLTHLYRLTRELDGMRIVMSNDGWQHTTSDLCTLHDYADAQVLLVRYRNLEQALAAGAREQPPYLPGYEYRGEPVILSEFGGVALTSADGFGYTRAGGGEQLLSTYREMVEALMQPGPVEGFCYTQLADIEEEQNGLLTFDRRPKVDLDLVRRVTETPKQPG